MDSAIERDEWEREVRAVVAPMLNNRVAPADPGGKLAITDRLVTIPTEAGNTLVRYGDILRAMPIPSGTRVQLYREISQDIWWVESNLNADRLLEHINRQLGIA